MIAAAIQYSPLFAWTCQIQKRIHAYLKMSRDAAAALKNWETQTDAESRRQNVRHVMMILSQSILWGIAALFLMGFKASEQDRKLRSSLEGAYDRIFGASSFKKLELDYIRAASIAAFFR